MKNNALLKLDWDSEFFSKNIATVVNINLVTAEQLAQYELVCNKVRTDDYSTIDMFSALNFKIVEGELSFEKHIKADQNQEYSFEQYIARETDITQLVSLAKVSYSASRFRLPWFNNTQKEKFYGKWIEKAVLGTFDDICLILKDGNNIQGFISLKKDNLNLSIGLIAVSKAYQGKGIAKKLLALAEQYAIQHQCSKMLVATQSSNLTAINLYTRNNYSISQSSYWLYSSKNTAP